MEQLGSQWMDFHESLIFEDFLKICPENSSLTRTRIKGTLHEDRYTFLSHLAHFCLE